ncbi:RdgB/HAM1 family non-canonical purine NTP pyrophosphatase [Rathayibacter soli]|uniref:RdgB/HAM1 family non-canonical purine NTP pyrophosphatase n=1 Tax=Rathayibacter soli TaxID=3144168 RepID=UPI0027E51A3A|nr:RdgB/HAM1 family non-canonical purine NTP pyrophosphatase [Glaciibacter superstes]
MSEQIRVVLATHNAHKVAEFQQILGRALPRLEIIPYDGPEPIEDGASFAENALIKARTASAHTGLPALADDSGVCVDILGGAPGIFSARWSGQHGDDRANRALLLDQLADVRDENRGAHFTATIALVVPGAGVGDATDATTATGATASETVVEGIWPGSIARSARGENGFGYDPVFIPAGGTTTSAELTAAEKTAHSHRARAFEKIIPALMALASESPRRRRIENGTHS